MEEYYWNKSEMSTGDMADKRKQLKEQIEQQSQDDTWKKNQIMLHRKVITMLSRTYFDQKLYVIGDEFTNKSIAEYTKYFRQGNTVEVHDMDEFMKQNKSIKFDTEKSLFTLVVIPFEAADNQEIKEQLEQRSIWGSTLVVYNIPDKYVASCNFGTHERDNQIEWKAMEERLYQLLEESNKAFDTENVLPGTKLEIPDETIDRMIKKAQLAEDYANEHYQQLLSENMKDDLNEVKNALLDYRYSQDKDYFLTEIIKKMSSILVYLSMNK